MDLNHDVTAVNDNPVLSGTNQLSYTENDAATPINPTITLVDIDSPTLSNATVKINANYVVGEDILSFTPNANTGNITAIFNSTTGTLFLYSPDQSGTPAQFEAALQAVSYHNTSENPSTLTRDVTFAVDDGSETHYLSNTVQSTIDVIAINDAPMIDITPTSYEVNEQTDLTLSGTGMSISDPDATNHTVHVTLSVGEGTLTVDAGDTNVLVTGSGSDSIVLSGSIAEINNLLAGNNNGTLTYFNNLDAPSASTVLTMMVDDLGNTGDGGALTATATRDINITTVNDAPSLSGNLTLGANAEDNFAPTPRSIADILLDSNTAFIDPDANATLGGLAVVANTADATTQGSWQYSTDGINWFDVGSVSDDASALALSADSQIRFVPVANYNGTPPALIVRALDNSFVAGYTDGETRSTVDTSANGGSTAISQDTYTLSTTVTAVNDAPVATGFAQLAADSEDTAAESVTTSTVGDLFGGNFDDSADQVTDGSQANTLAGIAITNYVENADSGEWQYSSDGSTWITISSVTDAAQALTLKSTDQLRFVPAADFNGAAPTLTVTLIDSSTSVNTGDVIDGSVRGDITPYSLATVDLNHDVIAVNDNPVLTGSSQITYSENDSATIINTAISLSDIDSPTLSNAIVSINANYIEGEDILGFIPNADTGNITAIFDSSLGQLVLFSPDQSGTPAQFEAALKAVTYSNTSENPSTAPRDITFSVDDGSATHYLSNTIHSTIDVVAVNDAPIIDATTTSYQVNEQTDLLLSGTGISISDPDATNHTVHVTLSVGEGTLTVETGDTNVLVTGSGSDSIVLSGSIAEINNLLAGNNNGTLTYFNNLDAPSASTVLTMVVDDLGNTGDGGALTATTTRDINITAVNDAPSLSGNLTLGANAEDNFAPTPRSIADILLDSNTSFVDPDANATLGGLAVVANTADATTQGSWQYSTDGINWFDVGSVSDDASALALSADSQLRFVPVANYNGTPPALIVRALDNSFVAGYTDGETRSTVDTSANGGSTAVSQDTYTLSTTVTAVNDAPVATGFAQLAADSEDTAADSVTTSTVGDLFGGNFDDSADQITGGSQANTLAGIAITTYSEDTNSGEWQYSSDGSTWITINSVTDSAHAFTLQSTAQLRFVPVADFNGEVPTLTVALIDSSTSVNTGDVIDVSVRGGSTPYSFATVNLSHDIIAVNDSPILSGTNYITYTENEAATPINPGITLVDIDSPTLSNAVVRINTNYVEGEDILSFTPNADTGNITALFNSTTGSLFLYSPDQSGTPAQFEAALKAVAYSNTSDNPSTASRGITYVVDDGSDEHYLSNTVQCTIEVVAVNDAPVAHFTQDGYQVNEQTNLILSGTGISISDPDAADNIVTATLSVQEGAITALAGSTNVIITGSGTDSIVLSGTIAEINDLLAGNNGSLLSYYNGSDTPSSSTTLTLAVNDLGNTGSDGDLPLSDSVSRVIDITAINDAPTAQFTVASYAVNEGTGLTLSGTGISISDPDAANSVVSVTLNVGEGILNVEAGNTNVIVTGSGTNTLLLSGSIAQINDLLAGNNQALLSYIDNLDAPSESTALTLFVNDLGNTGAGGALTATATRNINITAVNDAPSLSGNLTLTANAEDNFTPVSRSISDILLDSNTTIIDPDANATLGGLAVVANTSDATTQGSWQYSTDGINWFDVGSVSDDASALALSADSQLRFVPVANYNGTPPDLIVRALDDSFVAGYTDGETRSTVDTSANGGSTAVSQDTYTISTTVTAVNDAPVATGSAQLAADFEDTAADSVTTSTVGELFGGNFDDSADQITGGSQANTLAGVAITSYIENANSGEWQYSTDGSTWVTISSVSDDAHAFILQSTDQLRFVPVADFNGAAPALTVTLIDSSTSVNTGDVVDVSVRGGSTPYSIATVDLDHQVMAVNDKPVLSESSHITYTENDPETPINPAITLVDIDSPTLSNAVVKINSNYVPGEDILSFVPNADTGNITAIFNPVTGSLFLYSPDHSGTPSQFEAALKAVTYINTSDNPSTASRDITYTVDDGSATNHVSNIIHSTIDIIAENDAPIIDITSDAYQVNEQTDLILSGTGISISDPDAGNHIVNVTVSVGEGKLTVDAGDTNVAVAGSGTHSIQLFGTIAEINALLAGDSNSSLTYFNNLDAPSTSTTLSLVVNDLGNTGVGGELTSTATREITLIAVNDAPSLSDNLTLTTNVEDNFAPTTRSIADILQDSNASFIDPDANAHLGGLAVVANTADASTQGSWQYSTDGTNWFDIGSVGDDTSALALSADTQLRFVPVANYNGTPSALIVRALDDSFVAAYTDGETRSTVDASANGGSTSISQDTYTLSTTVTAVNDAPVASGFAQLATDSEDTAADSVNTSTVGDLFGGNFNDSADQVTGGSEANTLAGIAITNYVENINSGEWQYSSDGSTWVTINSVSDDAHAFTLQSTDQLRFVPATNFNGAAPTLTVALIDSSITVNTADEVDVSLRGGTTPYSLATVDLNHDIAPVNNNPVLSETSHITYTENDAATPINTAITLVDIDSQTLSSATVKINTNYVPGEDILSFTPNVDTGNITALFNTATGALTLYSPDHSGTPAQFEAALKAVSYRNTSENPSTASRDVTYVVDDGGLNHNLSNVIHSTIDVDSINDAPVATITPVAFEVNEQTALILSGTGISISDLDATNHTVQVTLSVGEGTLTVDTDNSNVLITGSGTSSIVLSGSIVEINALLAGNNSSLTYFNNLDAPAASTVLTMIVDDLGNTGRGGALTSTITRTIYIDAVNDSPSLSGNLTLTTNVEDNFAPTSRAISEILQDSNASFIDPDANAALGGLAIVANQADASTQGAWQYSTDGTHWFDVGSVSDDASALVLSATTQLRFVPVLNYNGTPPALIVRAIDDSYMPAYTDGATRITVDASLHGGSSSLSNDTYTLSTTVSAVNDAPVATGFASLAADLEDTAANAVTTSTVGNLFSGNFNDSADQVSGGSQANSLAGVAVTNYVENTESGVWQYSSDGSTWVNINTHTDNTHALILQSSDQLRFVPAANFNGAAPTLTVVLIDSSTTLNTGDEIDVSVRGGITPYSLATVDLIHDVNAVNDNPVLTGSSHITYIENHAAIPINTSISLTDIDSPILANAVVSITTNYVEGEDVLSFTPNADTGNITAVFDSSSGQLVLFSLNQTGTPAQFEAALKAVTYNNTSEHPSTATRDVTFTVDDGSASHYLSNALPSTIDVISINDAPTIQFTEDAYQATEQTILNLSGTGISIGDPDALNHPVNTLISVGEGSLSISTGTTGVTIIDSGSNYALLSGTIAQINDLFAGGHNGIITYYNGLDAPSASTTLLVQVNDLGNTGDGGELTAVASRDINITSVNDSPTLSGNLQLTANAEDNFTPISRTINQVFSDSSVTLIDPDSGAHAGGLVIVANSANTATQGTWQYSTDGLNWFDIGTVDDNTNALVLSMTTQIRFVPQPDYNGTPPALIVRGLDDSYSAGYTAGATRVTVDASSNGGSTSLSYDTHTLSTSVLAVNDAPIATGSATLAADLEHTLVDSLQTSTISQLFASNFDDSADHVIGGSQANTLAGVAITHYEADNTKGDWQYSSDGQTWNSISSVADASSSFTLKASDQLRFVPAADFNGVAPTLTVALIDSSTTVSTGATVDVSVRGDITAYSLQTVDLSHDVIANNENPILSGSSHITYTENDVATLINTTISLADRDSPTLANAVVTINLNYVAGEDFLTFTPNANTGNITSVFNSTLGTLTLFSLDQSGTPDQFEAALQAVAYYNTSENPSTAARDITFVADDGSESHYLSNTIHSTIDVVAVNDAPSIQFIADSYQAIEQTNLTISGTGITLADLDAAGHTVSAILSVGEGKLTVAAGTTGVTVLGSGTDSVLLSGTISQLNDLLAGNHAGSVTYYNGLNAPSAFTTLRLQVDDLGNTGISGALSAVETRDIYITAVNDAPSLSGNLTLLSNPEDVSTPDSRSITQLLTDSQVTFNDPDAGSYLNGLAVVANPANSVTQGTWQYSTDGSHWQDVGAVGDNSNALVLSTNTQIRFVPVANYNGTPPSLVVRAIDDSYGMGFTNGATRITLDTTQHGNATALSQATYTISTQVTPVNDAPLATGAAVLPADPEDSTFNTATVSSISSLFSANFNDNKDQVTGGSHADSLAGVAITHYEPDLAAGVWQYSSNGTTWHTLTTVTDESSALTLSATDVLRFLPAANYNGPAPAITTVLIDSSVQVISGATIDVSLRGDSTAYSVDSVMLTHDITPVNDNPVLTGISHVSYTENSDPVVIHPTIQVSDIDNTTLASVTITIANNYVNGQDILGFTPSDATGNITGSFTASTGQLILSSSDHSATLTEFEAAIHLVTYKNTSENPSTLTRDITFVANDGNNSHNLSNALHSSVDVIAINDAPTLSGPSTITYTENDPATIINNQLTISDVDSKYLSHATVRIVNFVPGEDTLSFAPSSATGNIVAGFNSEQGILILFSTDHTGTPSQFAAALHAVKYSNSSDNPTTTSREITFMVDDGGLVNQLSNTITSFVNIVPVNDAPMLTTHQLGGELNVVVDKGNFAPMPLFFNTQITTIERDQMITDLKVQVNNLHDGDNECLNVDGSAIALVDGNTGTTSGSQLEYTVTKSQNTASITLYNTTGVAPSNMETVVNTMSYQNFSLHPTAGVRTVALTGIIDSGSNITPNQNLRLIDFSSHIAVTTTIIPVSTPTVPEDTTSSNIPLIQLLPNSISAKSGYMTTNSIGAHSASAEAANAQAQSGASSSNARFSNDSFYGSTIEGQAAGMGKSSFMPAWGWQHSPTFVNLVPIVQGLTQTVSSLQVSDNSATQNFRDTTLSSLGAQRYAYQDLHYSAYNEPSSDAALEKTESMKQSNPLAELLADNSTTANQDTAKAAYLPEKSDSVTRRENFHARVKSLLKDFGYD